jgi:alkanesulfonate monooxygenase SsuD/methylene tetrahydromethanopterin reductase-like flavin-dependent oxidoreductase (luciferase family)
MIRGEPFFPPPLFEAERIREPAKKAGDNPEHCSTRVRNVRRASGFRSLRDLLRPPLSRLVPQRDFASPFESFAFKFAKARLRIKPRRQTPKPPMLLGSSPLNWAYAHKIRRFHTAETRPPSFPPEAIDVYERSPPSKK